MTQQDGWRIVVQSKDGSSQYVFSETDSYDTHKLRTQQIPVNLPGYKLLARDRMTGKWYTYYSWGLIS